MESFRAPWMDPADGEPLFDRRGFAYRSHLDPGAPWWLFASLGERDPERQGFPVCGGFRGWKDDDFKVGASGCNTFNRRNFVRAQAGWRLYGLRHAIYRRT